MIKPLTHLSELASHDFFLLDLWGVIHDGSAMYPGAAECLQKLKENNKRVIFLSNAPRRAAKAQSVLDALGVKREWYEAVVTSGEVGWRLVDSGQWTVDGFFVHRPLSTVHYYYIGPEKDADMPDGLPIRKVEHLQYANFLLNLGFGTEEQSSRDWSELLHAAAQQNLPMLCLNPDREVVKITGERYPCAGVIAEAYEAIGGKVRSIGKPYPEVYEYALNLFGNPPTSRVLAVGDSLHTDIAGAANAGIASVLVTGGILREKVAGLDAAALDAWLKRQKEAPDFVMSRLEW